MKMIFEHVIDPIDCELCDLSRNMSRPVLEYSAGRSRAVGWLYVGSLAAFGTLVIQPHQYDKLLLQASYGPRTRRFSLVSDMFKTHFKSCAITNIHSTSVENVCKLSFKVVEIGERSIPPDYRQPEPVPPRVREPTWTQVSNANWYVPPASTWSFTYDTV